MTGPRIDILMIEAIHRAFDRRTPSASELLDNIQRSRATRRGNHSLAPTKPQPKPKPRPARRRRKAR